MRNITNIHFRNVPLFFVTLLFQATLLILSITPSFADSDTDPVRNFLLTNTNKHLSNGCYIIKDGQNVLASYNLEKLFIPASIWKIATASMALHQLGPDFRFKTDFFQNIEGNLYIKGYGDPFLVSEEIDIIAEKLLATIDYPVKQIYVDQNYFDLKNRAHGSGTSLNPYDVTNAATAVNFNTISINISGSNMVQSAESQTPTLPFMHEFAVNLPIGNNRINISSKRQNVNRYIVELFSEKLFNNDFKMVPKIIEKSVPVEARLIYSHYSTKKLTDIIELMMLYSNNFIANQLFLTCGAKSEGVPANWQKAKSTMDDFLSKEIGLERTTYFAKEGSGLSPNNLISGISMMKILEYFKPYSRLLPLRGNNNVKTGTLTGVYSYAGYLNFTNKELPFVIMLNQPKNNREIILKEIISAMPKFYEH